MVGLLYVIVFRMGIGTNSIAKSMILSHEQIGFIYLWLFLGFFSIL